MLSAEEVFHTPCIRTFSWIDCCLDGWLGIHQKLCNMTCGNLNLMGSSTLFLSMKSFTSNESLLDSWLGIFFYWFTVNESARVCEGSLIDFSFDSFHILGSTDWQVIALGGVCRTYPICLVLLEFSFTIRNNQVTHWIEYMWLHLSVTFNFDS